MSEKPFLLGEWRVEPGLNRLVGEQETRVLVPKVMSLLMCLVRHAGQPVSQETIFAEVWPNQVVADSSLYQAVAQLRKALGDEAKQKQFIERVSGKGYRLVAEVKSISANPSEYIQKFNYPILLGSVFILLIVFITWQIWFAEDAETKLATVHSEFSIDKIDSITFIDLALEGEQSDDLNQLSALNDVLLTQLMHIGGIRVLSLSQPQTRVDTVAILKGKITVQENKVRVYLQLARVDNNQVIWAKFFEGKKSDLFGLQDLVVADLLALFSKQQPVETFAESKIDNRSFDQYLLARHFWQQRTPQSLQQSKQLLEDLRANDKLFPLAAVALCETYHFLYIYSDWSLSKASIQCEPLLEQALNEQPNLGQALAAKALLMSSQGNNKDAEQLFRRAVNLAPNYALGFTWYGNLIRDMGQYHKALALTLKAYELAPMSPIVNRSLAYSYLNLRQVENAGYYYQRAIAMEPDYFNRAISDLDFYPLNSERAINFLKWANQNPQTLARQSNFRLTQAQVWLALGDIDKVKNSLTEFKGESINPSFLLYVKASLEVAKGNYAGAAEFLQSRRELHQDSNRFDMPYVEALIFNQDYQKAQRLFLKSFPEFASPSITIDASNIYLAMFYVRLLDKLQKLQEWQPIIQLIDRYIEGREYPKNIYVAEWLAFRGQTELAKPIANKIMQQGWLPDTNSETFIYPRMRKLFSDLGYENNYFLKLLEMNRMRVKQVVKAKTDAP